MHNSSWMMIAAAIIFMSGAACAEESDAVKIHSSGKPVSIAPSQKVILTPPSGVTAKPSSRGSGANTPMNISLPKPPSKPTGGVTGPTPQRPPQKPVPVEQSISISNQGGQSAPRPPIEKLGSKQKPQTVTGQGTGTTQTGGLKPISQPGGNLAPKPAVKSLPSPPIHQSPVSPQKPGQNVPGQQLGGTGKVQAGGGGAQNQPAGGGTAAGNTKLPLGDPTGKNITGDPVGKNILGNPVGKNMLGNPG